MVQTPHIPKELVEYLESQFPDRMPDPAPLEKLNYKMGQVDVVRFLRFQLDKQIKQTLEGKLNV